MKSVLALMIACGMACAALGLTEPAAKTDATAGAAPAVAQSAIPVPDMPVMKTTTLDGGLIVEDMKIGTGDEIKAGAIVVAHYHGTLKDGGTEFDSSYKRGEPLGLPLASTIAGWQKGVPGMKVGGVRRLTVPAAMAYGDKSPSAEIPANSDLVFVMEIVDVMKIEDTKVGTGDAVTGRCVALTAYTMKDKNGKVLEKHDASDPYMWVRGESQAMALGLEGMKRGGKRTIVIPAAMNRFNPEFGKRVENVPLTVEVELLNLKNIPPEADAPGC
jgi:FKBP-type peptidyl-prolyl cis-trans isomerase